MLVQSKHWVRNAALWCGVLVMLAAMTPSAEAFEITIEIAPNTLNLQSEGHVVTVHTDVPYGSVDVTSIYLNGVLIHSWKADNRGYFVAKFLMDDIKTLEGLVIDGLNTLKIVGLTTDNESFWGEAEIMVIDVVPKGR